MTRSLPTVLLTGASGVVGRALIDELAADHHIIGLCHRTPIDDPRVEALHGDATLDRLGLTEAEYDTVCRRVDVVVHSAANTNWQAKPDTIMSTNVDGTARLLGLAARAEARYLHMSTAFVARGDGSAPQHTNVGGVTTYVSSKQSSEDLVRAAEIPTTILRPSILIGDSVTGRISAFQGIYKVISATYQGALPVLPADQDSKIDCVPQDVVTRAVRTLLADQDRTGEYWLTAGQHALSLEDMVRLTLDLAEMVGPRPQPPRMVPVESVDRLLIPLLNDVLPRGVRRQFDAFIQLMLLFQSHGAMPSSLPELGIALTHQDMCRAFSVSAAHYTQSLKTAQPAGSR